MKYALPRQGWLILIGLASLAGCSTSRNSGATIAFYNVENLFDTVNDPATDDDEFTPNGELAWDEERYQDKTDRLAKVIDELGHPEIMGLAEIENRKVLSDLCRKIDSKRRPYLITHFDSPDPRGIDVALLHRDPWEFVSSDTLSVQGYSPDLWRSRDILHVTLKNRQGVQLHVFVNHWPSRSGGVQESEPKRLAASRRLSAGLKELLIREPDARIVVMGDFNDLPEDRSMKLLTDSMRIDPGAPILFNPCAALQDASQGSYNFRGSWQMIDQILLSPNLRQGKYRFKDVGVHQRAWMMYQDKRNGPVPNRTYGGPKYFGGISDHLPVFVRMND